MPRKTPTTNDQRPTTSARQRAEHKPARKRRWGTEVRASARKLFVEAGLSFLDVGARLDVPESTVRKWAVQGHWNIAREEMVGSTRTLFEMTLRIAKSKIQELEKLPPESISVGMIDGLYKLILLVQNVRDAVPLLEAVVLTGEELITFVRRTVPDEATRAIVFDLWDKFLGHAKEA